MDYTKNGLNYNREQLLSLVRQQMSEQRFEHVLRVEQTALQLAKQYHADEVKVSASALLHDYGKERDDKVYLEMIDQNPEYENLRAFGNNIWHGILGSQLVKKELSLDNDEILHAIAVHTTGDINMTLLDKIIFVADYIEPKRSFYGLDSVRDLVANGDLNQAISLILQQTLMFLVKNKKIIYPYTIEVYNHWIKI